MKPLRVPMNTELWQVKAHSQRCRIHSKPDEDGWCDCEVWLVGNARHHIKVHRYVLERQYEAVPQGVA